MSHATSRYLENLAESLVRNIVLEQRPWVAALSEIKESS